MKKRPKRKHRRTSSVRIALYVLFACGFVFGAYKAAADLITAHREESAFQELSAIVASGTAEAAPLSTPQPAESKEPLPVKIDGEGQTEIQEEPPELREEKPPEILPQYKPLYEMNPDMFGWLSIADTNVDFPVMYTPDRPQFYIHTAFDGSYSYSGVPFIDEKCPADGNFYLIYGHHMSEKRMFAQLTGYLSEAFYKDHPTIRFDTLYEQREYTVLAVFLSRIYGDYEQGVFRYYDYLDLTDRRVFEEYVGQVKAAALYDTGVDADYGDELIALSTCNYHADEGRLVVVAKRVK